MRRANPVLLLAVLAVMIVVVVVLVIQSQQSQPLSQPFDARALRAVDPALITHHQVDEWPLELADPRAMAIADDGTVLVLGEDALIGLDATGIQRFRWSLPVAATALAARDGRILIAEQGRVHVVSGDGAVVMQVDLGPDSHVTAVDVINGDLVVADARGRRVLRLDAEGAVVNTIPSRIPADHYRVPELSMALHGHGGVVHVVNPGQLRIESYDLAGNQVNLTGRSGSKIEDFSGCHNPVALFVTEQGFLTGEKGVARVKQLDPDGRLLGVVPTPADFANAQAIIAVLADAQGRVLVLDGHRRMVRVFAERAEGGDEDDDDE